MSESQTFVKLLNSILKSSIWFESYETKIVWITLLAMADRNGNIWATPRAISHDALVPLPETLDALKKFQEPDPESRSEEYEGRRLEVIPGGFHLLNYDRVRNTRDAEIRREQEREASRRYRERHQESHHPSSSVIIRHQNHPASAQEEAEVDKDKPKYIVSPQDEKPSRRLTAYSDDFESWWKTWGKYTGIKVGKPKSFSYWKVLSSEDQMAAIENLSQYVERREAAKVAGVYVPNPPHPERFLRDRRWLDTWGIPEQDNTDPIRDAIAQEEGFF